MKLRQPGITWNLIVNNCSTYKPRLSISQHRSKMSLFHSGNICKSSEAGSQKFGINIISPSPSGTFASKMVLVSNGAYVVCSTSSIGELKLPEPTSSVAGSGLSGTSSSSWLTGLEFSPASWELEERKSNSLTAQFAGSQKSAAWFNTMRQLSSDARVFSAESESD